MRSFSSQRGRRTSRALMLSLAVMLSMANVVDAQPTYAWAGNQIKKHEVWEPVTSAWVPGQPHGYYEGETAAFLVELEVSANQYLKFQVCLDYDVSGSYAFTQMEPWDTTEQNVTLPGNLPLTDTSNPLAYARNATVQYVSFLGEETGAGLTRCPLNYLAYEIGLLTNAGLPNKSIVYVVYGGHLAQAGDPLPTGGTVPPGLASSNVGGTFQARVSSVNIGDKTINFQSTAILEATADLALTKICPDFLASPPYYYTITVTSGGPSGATGVTVVDPLPTSVAYLGFTSELTTGEGSASQGTCSLSGQTVTCTLGTLLPSTTADATAKWTILIEVEVVDPNNADASNSATASATELDPVPGNNTGTCTTTTPVTLAYFQAARSGEMVRFEWSTATETGNVGFNLYAQTGNGRRRINAELVPSQVVDSMEPQDYVFEATGVDGDKFFLEDVDLFGRTRQHGPFVIGEAYGARVVPEPIDWATVRGEHAALEAQREAERRADVQAQIDLVKLSPYEIYLPLVLSGAGPGAEAERIAAVSAPPGKPASVAVASLLVSQTGLYRVTYEDLLAAGLDLKGIQTSDLALMNRGAPVSIYVESSGPKIGPGSYLEFYGQELDTLYTDINVYILQINRSLAKRVAEESTPPDPSAEPVPFYMETAEVDDNLAFSFSAPSREPWYDTRMLVYKSPKQWTFALDIENYVSEASPPSTATVGLWGITDWPGSPDHHVVVEFGQTLADEWFDGLVDHPVSLQMPPGSLQEGSNTFTVTMPADNGQDFDLVYLDRYSVTYPRRFVAQDGRLTFTAAGALFRIDGLPTPSVVVYRLDGQNVSRMTQVQITDANGAFSALFAGSNMPATYLVSSVEAMLLPGIEAGWPTVDISSGSADYFMIAHPDFIDGLAPLVAARQAQGYTVRVVNVKDIYAQFGYGILDAQAIRDYISYATNQMGAQYFLLVGGDTYDYRNYLGTGAISFMPSLYAATSDVVSYAPVDPLYTDQSLDGMPDRPIGRFPVRTSAELEVLIGKTLAYETKDYGRTSTFTADLGFSGDSQSFVDQMPPDWSVQRAHADEVGIATARATLIDSINAGAALVNFVGHSDWIGWSFDNLLLYTDVRALTNAGRPTVVAQYGCWNNWYLTSSYNTLAHSFLVYGSQGAAAVLGPTALADAPTEAALGRLVTAQLIQPGMTVGAAVQTAKAELAAGPFGTPDVLLGWVLLGDPTLAVQP